MQTAALYCCDHWQRQRKHCYSRCLHVGHCIMKALQLKLPQSHIRAKTYMPTYSTLIRLFYAGNGLVDIMRTAAATSASAARLMSRAGVLRASCCIHNAHCLWHKLCACLQAVIMLHGHGHAHIQASCPEQVCFMHSSDAQPAKLGSSRNGQASLMLQTAANVSL